MNTSASASASASESAAAPTAFIGGGNMASAIIGGLVDAGRPRQSIVVVEPDAGQRERLQSRLGVQAMAAADASLAKAATIVWAVKPQSFAAACAPCGALLQGALHLSVMAGIRSDALRRATGAARIVRAMPNTPALIGQGIAGLYAAPAVTAADQDEAERLLAPTGRLLWVAREADLDAVTALSGSGPAYVFYFIEAMIAAGREMGLPEAQARELAQATFAGAAELAARSDESVKMLRERVTSKGGTTHAALAVLDEAAVNAAFQRALRAAQQRARELGDEFGAANGG